MTVALLLKFSFAFEFIEVVRPVIVYTPSPSAGGGGGPPTTLSLTLDFGGSLKNPILGGV